MITIQLTQFNFDETDRASDVSSLVESYLDRPSKKINVKEDAIDEESSFDVIMVYDEMKMHDLDVWDELMDLGLENEIYVIVYDHELHLRRGFWYDEEEQDWVDLDMTGDDYYDKLIA